MNVTINISKEEFPKLFINTENIEDEVFNIFKTGYQTIYNNDIQVDNALVSEFSNVCRRFKDDIIYNMNTRSDGVTNEIVQLRSSVCVEEKLDEFTKIVEQLFGISYTSCKKGEISENFIYNIFTTKFKNYCYDKKRHIPHNADGELNSPSGMKALVEIKNYTKSVNKDELDKFKFDLTHNSIRFGLFISLQSGIIGHQNISYECMKHNGEIYHIVYIAFVLDGSAKMECGVLLLEKLFQLDLKSKKELEMELVKDSIMTHFKEIDTVCSKTSQLKDNFINMERTIKDSLHSYYTMFRDYEYELKTKINDIWNKISKDFDRASSQLVEDDTMDKIVMEAKKGKDKCYLILLQLFDILREHNMGLLIDGKKWNLIDGKLGEIGEIKKMKNKVNVMIKQPTTCILFNCKQDNDQNFRYLKMVFKML